MIALILRVLDRDYSTPDFPQYGLRTSQTHYKGANLYRGPKRDPDLENYSCSEHVVDVAVNERNVARHADLRGTKRPTFQTPRIRLKTCVELSGFRV